MRKLIIPFVAACALAAPTAVLACDGSHHRSAGTLGAFFSLRSGDGYHNVLFAKLSGTGSSFGDASSTASGSIVGGNDHENGHFSISLSTNWSQAQSKTFTEEDGDTVTISCAPASATSTLSNGSTSTATLTGKTCSKTAKGVTKYGFFGRSNNGVHLFLKEDASNNVRGFEFSRS